MFSVYCPAGVLWLDCPPPPLPPHEQNAAISNIGSALNNTKRFPRSCLLGKAISPRNATTQNHVRHVGDAATDCRALVVTVTVKLDCVVAFRVTVPGTEQAAPRGAAVKVIVAVPAIPAPPMTRL
jgi:hypothetical protein